MSERLPRRAAPLKARDVVSPWYWAEVYSQRAKRGRKREDTVYLFSEWRVFRSTNRLSYWDNGSRPPCCALPAPLPPHSPSLYLPLSRNTRHILLRTTHQPKVHFLLLSSSPSHQPLFPGHALTAASCAQIAQGHPNRQANASPRYRYTTLPSPLSAIHFNAIKQISNSAHPTEMFSHYLALPSCTDLEWQWKHVVLF